MEFRPRHCALAADGAVDGGRRAVEVLEGVGGLVLRLLGLGLGLVGLDLLHGYLLLAAVVVAFWVVHWGGHGLLLGLRYCGLLVLVGFEGRGAEGLVGVLVCGACLHGGDGGLALVDAVIEELAWVCRMGWRRESLTRAAPWAGLGLKCSCLLCALVLGARFEVRWLGLLSRGGLLLKDAVSSELFGHGTRL